MTDAKYKLLEDEVALLRRAVGDLERAKNEDTTPERLNELTVKVDLMVMNMDLRFAEIVSLLTGGGGGGPSSVLDHIIETVRAMGNVVGEMHRKEQMHSDVAERLVAKLSFEEMLLSQLRVKEINNMRQAIENSA